MKPVAVSLLAATVGLSGGHPEGALERQTANSARRLGKVESLRKRQDDLRAQLAASGRHG